MIFRLICLSQDFKDRKKFERISDEVFSFFERIGMDENSSFTLDTDIDVLGI